MVEMKGPEKQKHSLFICPCEDLELLHASYAKRPQNSHKCTLAQNYFIGNIFIYILTPESLFNFSYDIPQIEQLWSSIPLIVDVKLTPRAELQLFKGKYWVKKELEVKVGEKVKK